MAGRQRSGRRLAFYRPVLIVLVDLAGGPPGSCAMALVRDVTSPLWTFVLVFESLQVPPSCARAFDMLLRLLSLPPVFVLLVFRVPPAALPALPTVDEVSPDGLVDVPPVPIVEAEVPPAAPLPPVPPVAAEPCGPLEDPPLPMLDALWPNAALAQAALSRPAAIVLFQFIAISRLIVLLLVDRAFAVRRHDRGGGLAVGA
jgi:hypothetical protein